MEVGLFSLLPYSYYTTCLGSQNTSLNARIGAAESNISTLTSTVNGLSYLSKISSFILEKDINSTIAAYGRTDVEIDIRTYGFSSSTYGKIVGYTVLSTTNYNVAVHIVSTRDSYYLTFRLINLVSSSVNAGTLVGLFVCIK